MNLNSKFNPELLIKDDVFKGEPLDSPVTTERLCNGKQVIRFASINKKNLSLGPYQRPEDSKRISAIAGNYHPDFGVINVAEILHNDKYYYTIPDGQHRAKGQPENSCPCIITNSLPEAELFLLANNPKCTKSTSPDDRFWASLYNEEKDHVWFYNFMQDNHGVQLSRNTKENVKAGKFTGGVSIYKNYYTILRDEKRMNTTKGKLRVHESEIEKNAREKFSILCTVMFNVFNKNDFYANSETGKTGTKTAYSDLWSAMRRFLNSPDYDWREPSDAIEALKKGYYAKGGRGQIRSEPVLSIEDYHKVARADYPDSQRVDQLRCVISALYKKGR
jgi:hypothetical protein